MTGETAARLAVLASIGAATYDAYTRHGPADAVIVAAVMTLAGALFLAVRPWD